MAPSITWQARCQTPLPKFYNNEYISFDDISDHHNLGIISIIQQNSTLMQAQCPIFHIRISIYMSFKKNINV